MDRFISSISNRRDMAAADYWGQTMVGFGTVRVNNLDGDYKIGEIRYRQGTTNLRYTSHIHTTFPLNDRSSTSFQQPIFKSRSSQRPIFVNNLLLLRVIVKKYKSTFSLDFVDIGTSFQITSEFK